MEAKNSLIFRNGKPLCKNGDPDFNVGQNSFDGAETCEVKGLYETSWRSYLMRNIPDAINKRLS